MQWTYKEKKKPEWMRAFALFPTRIGDVGSLSVGDIIVWLCFYERKWHDCYYGWDSYDTRLIPKK